jgi:hypothetical protein
MHRDAQKAQHGIHPRKKGTIDALLGEARQCRAPTAKHRLIKKERGKQMATKTKTTTKTDPEPQEDMIGQIEIHTFRIKGGALIGNAGLLMDKPPDDLKPAPKNWSDEKKADFAAYKDKDGNLIVYPLWFRTSLVDGATARKIAGFGRLGAPAVLKMFVQLVNNDPVLLTLNGEPIREYKINKRHIRNAQNQLVQAVQPQIDEWECEISLEIDVSQVGEQLVLAFMNLAGRIAGVGAWKPKGPGGGSGPYGKYRAELIV